VRNPSIGFDTQGGNHLPGLLSIDVLGFSAAFDVSDESTRL
jgi:hypothetical protein